MQTLNTFWNVNDPSIVKQNPIQSQSNIDSRLPRYANNLLTLKNVHQIKIRCREYDFQKWPTCVTIFYVILCKPKRWKNIRGEKR